jgi:uncharacterized protein (DUF3084 family)
MRKILGLVIAFLIGFSLFSFFQYIKILGEREKLLDDLNETRLKLEEVFREKELLDAALEKEKMEKEDLRKEKGDLEKDLLETKERLANKIEELLSLKERIGLLEKGYSLLKRENFFLRKRLTSLKEEKEDLELMFDSLEELKKRIKELKLRMQKIKLEERKKRDRELLGGNRGYLIKDGKSTFIPKYKIEVILSGDEPDIDLYIQK